MFTVWYWSGLFLIHSGLLVVYSMSGRIMALAGTVGSVVTRHNEDKALTAGIAE
jgi:hypothetical protein